MGHTYGEGIRTHVAEHSDLTLHAFDFPEAAAVLARPFSQADMR